ncbi:MAG: glycosyltransferase [Candidatus Levyibacteriota bacterium]|nr:MAG: glycosyltransferase [Candidatus Levybacteria bacterium]
MEMPLISVVIATYSCERTIEKCLISIKEQKYPNVETIVVDSINYKMDEKYKKIIKKYARYLSDGPERSIQRNRGIHEAKGEYVLVLDQDMYLTSKVLEDCYKRINDNIALIVPEISIGVGYWTKCVAFERYISIFLEEGMNECCRFFKKKDALAIGGYDPTIVGAEDSDFHYRMKKIGSIGKIKNHLYHDEGRINFFGRVKKKYYYSKAFSEFLKRHPDIAVAQFFPIKKAYIKHFDLLLRHPFLTAGLVLLRSGEVLAGLLGMLVSPALESS